MARQLFSEKGIYWATVEDITESADLGKGTFYKYFESKEAIIRVLLEDGLNELLTETERAIQGISPGPQLLSAVITTRIDFFLDHPDYLLMFHQVRGFMQLQAEGAKELRAVYAAHIRNLAQLLRPAMGTAESKRVQVVAIAVAAYTSGLLTYHVLFEKLERVRRRRDGLVRALELSLLALLTNPNDSDD